MRRISIIVLLASLPLSVHRLDEYVQGAIVSVEKDRVAIEMTLTPGVAVFPSVIAAIDTDSNGSISESERRSYVSQVQHDLTLSIDGRQLTPEVVSTKFPSLDEMQEGREIQIVFHAALPEGGRHHKLSLENHHQTTISTYLMNSIVPRV